MSTVTLTLSDDKLARLADEARDRGLTVEALLEQVAADHVARGRVVSDAAFQKAKAHTFRENAELYRRLASS